MKCCAPWLRLEPLGAMTAASFIDVLRLLIRRLTPTAACGSPSPPAFHDFVHQRGESASPPCSGRESFFTTVCFSPVFCIDQQTGFGPAVGGYPPDHPKALFHRVKIKILFSHPSTYFWVGEENKASRAWIKAQKYVASCFLPSKLRTQRFWFLGDTQGARFSDVRTTSHLFVILFPLRHMEKPFVAK